jgi:hypothetical protein
MSEPNPQSPLELSSRARAILRATWHGRVQVSLSCEPDIFVDGLVFSDQPAARALVHAGLLRATRQGQIGDRVPAKLTSEGYTVLSHADPPSCRSIA